MCVCLCVNKINREIEKRKQEVATIDIIYFGWRMEIKTHSGVWFSCPQMHSFRKHPFRQVHFDTAFDRVFTSPGFVRILFFSLFQCAQHTSSNPYRVHAIITCVHCCLVCRRWWHKELPRNKVINFIFVYGCFIYQIKMLHNQRQTIENL